MGCGESKYDHKKGIRIFNIALKSNPFFVGPSIFVNLNGIDIHKYYKIQKELGKGAFGEVRLVENLITNQLRAMKKIKKNNDGLDEQILQSEAQMLLYMDHPNVLKVYEAYQDSKNYYIVTEYLQGGNLLERVTKLEKINEEIISKYMKQVFQGLFHCHSCGIIHRDIKPHNIIFESDDGESQLKLIDFGASKKREDIYDYEAKGTPLYISPDIFNEEYDEKCDVWSCGIMLFQLLTGKFPYNDQQPSETIIQIIRDNQLNISVLEQNQQISQQAKNLVKKMLQFNPKKRISIEQVLEDPWIKMKNNTIPLKKDVIQNLSDFHCSNKLKCAILQLIATQLSGKQEKNKLIEQFKAIDKDHNGKLSRNELENGYIKLYHDELMAKQKVDQILKFVDFDNSQTLDYSEFLVAAFKQEELLQKKQVDDAFKLFDQDNNGFITIKELQKVMSGAEKNIHWQELIQDFDQNGDGQISHAEFVQTIITKTNQIQQ